MRKRIVAGNWKMNLSLEGARSLASEVTTMIINHQQNNEGAAPEVIFFPPFVFLNEVVTITETVPGVFAGAQNCHQEPKGAYTGEVSVPMIRSCGATHVIIGHSERRTIYNEDDSLIAAKVNIALENELVPVFCCGEQLPQRESGEHFDTVKQQLSTGLFHLNKDDFSKVIIAYEPVWAIGTGKTATPQQAQEMHSFIRKLIEEKFGDEVAQNTSILYGGSCNSKNASELFSKEDVDGGLIGGASLKPDEFIAIIRSF